MDASAKETPTTIVVPSEKTTSYVTAKTVIGTVEGAVLGAIVSSTPAGAAIGAAVDGVGSNLLAKNQLEHEQQYGVVVKKPYSRTSDILKSSLLGAGMAAIIAASLVTGVFTASVVMAVAGAGLAGAAIGGLLGAKLHEGKEREYESAQNYYIRHGGNYQGREREAQRAHQISPEENELLNKRLAEDRSQNERMGRMASAGAAAGR